MFLCQGSRKLLHWIILIPLQPSTDHSEDGLFLDSTVQSWSVWGQPHTILCANGGSSWIIFPNTRRRLLLLISEISHHSLVASQPFCLWSNACACLSDCMWYVCGLCTCVCAGAAHSWFTEEARGSHRCPGPWLSTYSFEKGSLTEPGVGLAANKPWYFFCFHPPFPRHP